MKTSEILESAAFVAMVPGAWCQGEVAETLWLAAQKSKKNGD